MPVATCPPPEELSSLLLGRVPQSQAEELEQHVETCAHCQATVKSLSSAGAGPVGDWLAAGVRAAGGGDVQLEPGCQEAMSRIRRYAPEATEATIAGTPQTTAGQGKPTAAKKADAEPTTEGLGTIREYRLLAKLGEGGMGAVYKAQHTKLKRIVALKVLPAGVVNTPGVVARFEREMQAVGALDHPNIVRAFDAGENEGRHYLVMEYVKGRDLTQLSRNCGRLPIAEACELVRQAAVGLQHAHEAGLVHRDIKPSNLMLTDTGVVKILDLGLALLSNADGSGELTSTGQVMGTIDYMAPEQGGDTHNVDIRADIYSLGATLYKLLTGVAPFGDPKFDTPVKKLMALATQEPIPVKQRRAEITPALAAVIAKMLAKDSAKRYATPVELAKALAPFTAGGNLPQLAARAVGDKISPSAGEAETQPSLKSASADTVAPAAAPITQGDGYWDRFQRQPFYVRWLALSVLALLGGGAAAWALSGIVLFWETPNGTVRIEILDDKIQAQFDKDGLTITGADKKPIKIHAAGEATKPGEKAIPEGSHLLVIKRDGLEFETDTFELKKAGRTTLKIKLVAGKVQVTANGQPLRATQRTPPAPDYALSFNGEDCYVEIPSLRYDGSHPITLEAWVVAERLPADDSKALFGWQGVATCNIGPGGDVVGVSFTPQREFVRSSPRSVLLTLGKPQHVALVWDGKRLRQFVGGVAGNPIDLPKLPNVQGVGELIDNNFALGCEISIWSGADRKKTRFLAGQLRNVRISKIARYDENFTPSATRLKPDSNTLALYYFDEGQGEELKDSSGNNHHGKIVGAKWVKTDGGGPSPVAQSARYALAFDGDDQVKVEKIEWGKLENYTFEAFVNPERLHEKVSFIVNRYKYSLLGLNQSAYSGNWLISFTCKDQPPGYAYGDARAELNKRVHVAGVARGRQFRLYVDGQLAATNTTNNELDYREGGHLTFGDRFAGRIDGIRISRIDRYDAPFQPSVRFEKDADTLALYNFAEGSGAFLIDSSGNGLHGTIQGAKWVRLGDSESPAEPSVLPLASSAAPEAAPTPGTNVARKAHLYTVKPYWSVAEGELLFGSDEFKHQWIFFGDKTWADYDFQARVLRHRSGSGSGGVSLAFRSAGPNFENTGLFGIGSRGAGLKFNLAGKFFSDEVDGVTVPPLAAARQGLVNNRWYTLKVEVRGSTVRCYLNGEFQGSFDKLPFAQGKVGLHVNSSTYRIRDIQVTAPDGAVLWSGLPDLPVSPLPVPSEYAASSYVPSASDPPPAIAPFDVAQAKSHQDAWAKHLGLPVEYTNSLGMKFRLIPPGEFLMGAPQTEIDGLLKPLPVSEQFTKDCIASEGPQHRVILTQPYYLATCEVTQQQYLAVQGTNPSYFAKTGASQELAARVAQLDTSQHPVEGVIWSEAAEFTTKLSVKERLQPCYTASGDEMVKVAGNGYRLPTEAEWEFACRAGTVTPYFAGDQEEDLTAVAWWGKNSGNHTRPVGELRANPFGLHDISGNIWEWVEDAWGPDYFASFRSAPALDPRGPEFKKQRMIRGGSWWNPAFRCRTTARVGALTGDRVFDVGFRVALSVDAVRDSLKANPSAKSHALLFDDRTDAVDLSAVTYDGSHDLTIEGWFKTLEFNHSEFARFEPDGPVIFAMPKGKQGEIGAEWKDENGKEVYAICSEALRVGQLQHVALVYRRQRMLIFVDGKPIAESEVPIKAGVVRAMKVTNALMELHGLRISRKNRYSLPFEPELRFANDADTLALFHCDEGAGEILQDSSGNNRHGKLAGPKWAPLEGSSPSPSGQALKAQPLKLAEPPPTAEWLKGRDVLTVAQDGSGQFKTIQAALDALQSGQVVKVLDKGPYRETLNLATPPADIGLVSEVKTVLEVAGWRAEDSPAGRDLYGQSFSVVENFRLAGFKLTYNEDSEGWVHVLHFPLARGVVVEDCSITRAASSKSEKGAVVLHAGWSDSDNVATAFRGHLTAPFIVRDCQFDGRVYFTGFGGSAPIELTRCHLTSTANLLCQGQLRTLAIHHNVFEGTHFGIEFLELAAIEAVQITNNTGRGAAHNRFWPQAPDEGVTILNNIWKGTFKLGLNAEERELNLSERQWQVGHNAYVDPPMIRQPGDLSSVRFLSVVPMDRNYLRIDAESATAKGGVGGHWPGYMGALPPGPAPQGGDWFTRLRERWLADSKTK